MCSPVFNLPSYKEPRDCFPCYVIQGPKCLPCGMDPVTVRRPLIVHDSTFDYRPTSWPGMLLNSQDKKVRYQLINYERPNPTFATMSVLPRGFECRSAAPRYGCVKGEYSIYYKRPCYGQPRPQPFQKEVAPYYGGPSNAPRERPCCYDFPCKADCFNHGAATRPSGRYARTTWYPGECCPPVPPCQAFTYPNPPYHPCCVFTVNKNV